MNRIYRLVWRQASQSWTAVAENAKGHGKSIAGRKLVAAALALTAVSLATPIVQASPTGGTVVAGTATISSKGNTQTVTQTSNRAIINWQGFSLSPGEVENFVLPSSSAAILNRVTGGNPAVLLGNLTSNGQVYLIDSSGVVIGPQGKIQTASFIASTLDLSNNAFMQGGSLQFSGNSTASITNFGTIATSAGDVALIGLNVVNQGAVKAPNGQAILAAGGEVLYVPGGQGDVLVEPATAPASIDNEGMIAAASVQLKAAGSAYALAVNNGGMISAATVTESGGRVILDGGAGDVVSTGSIAAAGTGGTGGAIALSAGRIAVTGTLDASGATAGGQIDLAATDAITVTASATLRADATQTGNGGQISVKAGEATQFDGTASARGGALGGNGGSAEISGGTLGFTGSVDLTAPRGVTGKLLFDPDEITIDSSATALQASVVSTDFWNYTDNPGSQTVGASAIVAQLATSNLTLDATTSITVSSAISSNTSNFLALNAPTVAVNANISLPNGTLNFNGGGSAQTTLGTLLSSASNAAINANTINIAGYAQTTLAGPVTTNLLSVSQQLANSGGAAATSFSATNAGNAIASVILNSGEATPDTYTGNIALSTTGALTVEGSVSMTGASGAISIVSSGNLTISNPDVYETQLTTAGGQITLASTGGAFINDVAAPNANPNNDPLFAGTGRRVIYSATTGSGYTDGGLGYGVVNSVSYPNDPNSGTSHVIYVAAAAAPPPLPVLTITVNNATRTYGQADPGFTVSYSGGSAADLQALPQLSIVGGSDANAGTYAIVPTGAVASGYQVVYVPGTLTVTPAPLTVGVTARNTYGGTPTASYTYSGFVNGDSAASLTAAPVLPAGAAKDGAGTYSIMASGAADPNYAITYAPGTLSVTPAPLTIGVTARDTYGGTPTASYTYSGLVNGDSAASLTAAPVLPSSVVKDVVGTYSIMASGAADPNYTITYVPGTLTVTPATLTVAANNVVRTYGNPVGDTLSYSGLVNGDTPTSVFTILPAAPGDLLTRSVGTYTESVTAGYLTDPNYTVVYRSGTLAVTPAPLTIVATSTGMPSGGTEPKLTGTFIGLAAGDTPASTGFGFVAQVSPANTNLPVGYPDPINLVGSDPNYAVTYVPGILAIGPSIQSTIITPSSINNAVNLSSTLTSLNLNTNNSQIPTNLLADPPQTTVNVNSNNNSPDSTSGMTSLNLQNGLQQTNNTQQTNFNDQPATQSVTINNSANTIALTLPWMGAEESTIVQSYVNAMNAAGSNPPLTVAEVESQLFGGGANATQLEAALLPYAMAQLQNILNENSSKWTAADAAFVQGMQNFIQQQRQQAAIQAENAYAAWQQQQQAQEQADLAPLAGTPAYAYALAGMASNPPVPPQTFINIVNAGTNLTAQQSVLKLMIGAQAVSIASSAVTAEQQKANAELVWLDSHDSGNPQLAQYKNQLASSDPNTALNAALAIDAAYQNASGPSNLPGYTGGAIHDVGQAIVRGIQGTGQEDGTLLKTLLGQSLNKLIFPKSFRINGLEGVAVNAQTQEELANLTDKISSETSAVEKGAQTAAKGAANVTSAMDMAGAVLGPLGLVLEVAGNVAQIGTGIAEYSQVGTYNKAFSQAVNNANATVTVADLKAMMNNGQMTSYMAGAMAIGPNPPLNTPATTSLNAIVTNAFAL